MKKFLPLLLCLLYTAQTFAQQDTTVVNSNQPDSSVNTIHSDTTVTNTVVTGLTTSTLNTQLTATSLSVSDELQLIDTPNDFTGNVTIQGNLGIGVTTALEKLHVNGAIRGNIDCGKLRIKTDYGTLDIGAGNSSFTHIYTDRPEFAFNTNVVLLNGKLASYSGIDLNFYTSRTSPRMTILNSNGYVGVATTSPTSTLDVNGTMNVGTTTKIKFSNWSGGKGAWIDIPVASGVASGIGSGGIGANAWIGYAGVNNQWFTGSLVGDICYRNSNGKLLFGNTSTAPTMTISSNKIGIGTLSPDALLTVNGTIHAKEIQIDLKGSLADYVFSADYNLMSLTDIENYVKDNHHLPDMPSAKDVENNGLNVGEMQNKLLQKIEELTLHMIEQQKIINEQSSKIKELEKKIK